jgi:hypothetical protein
MALSARPPHPLHLDWFFELRWVAERLVKICDKKALPLFYDRVTLRFKPGAHAGNASRVLRVKFAP